MASTLRPGLDADSLERVELAALLSIPSIRKLVIAALDDLKGIGQAAVSEALATGSTVQILAALDLWEGFETSLRAIFADTGPLPKTIQAMAASTIESLPVTTAITPASIAEGASSWLQRHGAKQVTAITHNTQASITRLVQNGFAGEETLAQVSRRILRLNGFGLTVPQTKALERYGMALQADGVGARRIRHLMGVRFRKMKRQRADLVGKTEAYRAAGYGEVATWRAANADGSLAAYLTEWVAIANACPRCQALDGTTAEIDGGVFTSRPVASGAYRGQIIVIANGEQVHPGDRCGRRLIRREDAEAA